MIALPSGLPAAARFHGSAPVLSLLPPLLVDRALCSQRTVPDRTVTATKPCAEYSPLQMYLARGTHRQRFAS